MSEAAAERTNFCYRHPDRQSFVLCQRCGRTICGECQTPAPVGVICPECMREQRATMPRTKPAVITRTRAAVGRGAPVVTYSIIGITVLTFLGQVVPGSPITAWFFFTPQAITPQVLQPWRLLTVALVHSTGLIFHVLLNMYTLWIFGQLLEPLLGRWRFLTLYLVSALAGSAGVVLLAPEFSQVVGASGAIFGLMGAFLVIQRRLGGNTTQLLVLVGINLVLGFVPGFNISWQAHLGGLIGGALVGLIFVETRKRDQQGLQVLLTSGLVVLLLIACFRYVLFPGL